MQLSLAIDSGIGFEQVKLTVKHDVENVVEKLVAAIKDGRVPVGPYHSDWEFDDDGAAWVNAEFVIDGVWHGIGANESTGELLITRGLEDDPLDGTAGPDRDLDHYWIGFVSPLKKLLAIIQ